MGTYTKAQLETELTRIKNAVASCRTAIYNQGVLNIPSDVTLAQLPTYVNMIDCSHPDILLDYIQAGDGSNTSQEAQVYFDTGFVPDASTSFEIVCSRPKTGSSNMMFGSYCYNIRLYSSTYLLTYANSWQTIDWNIGSTPSTYGNMTYISTSINGSILSLTIDSSTYTKSITVATKNDTSIYLFARHASDTNIAWTANSGSRIKYVKFYSNHNLVRFYVPVLHYIGRQYVPCFYDKVNDNYIYNLGSGTVTYSATSDYLLDYIYVPTSNRGVYYNTNWTIELHQNMDIKYVSGNVIAGGNINEGPMFGSTYNGTYKYGIYAPAAGAVGTTRVVKNGFKLPRTSSTYQFYGSTYSTSDTNTHVVSVYSNVANNYRRMYDNSVSYIPNENTVADQSNSVIGTKLGIFGGTSATTGSMQSSFPDTRIYYACVAKQNASVSQSWVPVLHNNIPSFYDVVNSTYITNSGSQTPGYEKLN